MSDVTIHERDVTTSEGDLMSRGIKDHAAGHGDLRGHRLEVSFVAMDGDAWVGVASGWVPVQGGIHGDWFYLAELFVEAQYRGRGIGAELLRRMEQRVSALEIRNVWIWTAGYEAPDFYRRQGYSVYAEMQDSYTSGHARVGLSKRLAPAGVDQTVAGETAVCIEERLATEAESEQMNRGFEIHSEEHGNPILPSERISFVALSGQEFVGISTGLAQRRIDGYSAWFGVTEFMVTTDRRGVGTGKRLLEALENKLRACQVGNIWFWAADFESGFFLRHDFEVFYRMEGYHPGGHTRVGLQKTL
jgi:predicted N-acetyltransferase YhbS